MKSGFARGTLRNQRTLTSYRITKYPVTWAQYDACVRAGACQQADASACGPASYAPYGGYAVPDYGRRADAAPAVCVGERQAEGYCTWIGGHLPTLDQWLLAARGDSPRRFSWGDAPTGCDQHLAAPQLLARLDRDRAWLQAPAGASCSQTQLADADLAIGRHPKGASPFGVEDAMLAPGELLAGEDASAFNACGQAAGHCLVVGLEPGAIDSVETFYDGPPKTEAEQPARMVSHAYAFRCVIDATEQP